MGPVNIKRKAYPLVLAFFFLCLISFRSHAQLFTVTPHDLLPDQRVVVEGGEVPPWKTLWDDARNSALQGDFKTALRQYNDLLTLKSNLEEARWELARLLMYLKSWPDAAALLELLIEADPENLQYINTSGKVMLEMEQYERAVDFFKRGHEEKPSDKTALAGLVEGLLKLGRKSETVPYLEQLIRQEPTNRGVRRYLALILYELGSYEKALTHFTILTRSEGVELEVLYKTAKTHQRLGHEQQASAYWQRVLAREPDNLEGHVFLADHFEKMAQLDRSLDHYQAILAQSPEDASFYARFGARFENSGEYDKALKYYENYLRHYPDDSKVIQRVAAINTAARKKKQVQPPPQLNNATNIQGQVESLKADIRNLEEMGRFHDTMPLYRQLFKISPEDHEIIVLLVKDLLAISDIEGQDAMLTFLSGTVPDNEDLYRAMADILRSLAREDELLAVLRKIHELDPGDTFTTEELAILHLNRDELQLSRNYFTELTNAGCWNATCLEARALLAQKISLPAHALADYEALLRQNPGRNDIRLAAIALAAQLGLLDTAVFHAGYLQNFSPVIKNFELKFLLAEAYRKSGYLHRAIERYQDIIAQSSEESGGVAVHFRFRSRLGLAKSFEDLGLMYEAEQTLRTALVSEEFRLSILDRLFYLFLDTGRLVESAVWLQAINYEIDELQRHDRTGTSLEWQKYFYQAEMYEAFDNYELAIDFYQQAESLLIKNGSDKTSGFVADKGIAGFRLRKQMAAAFMQDGKHPEAEQIVLGLQDRHGENLEILVLLEQIYLAWGKNSAAENAAETARGTAAQDLGRQLTLAGLYKDRQDPGKQFEAAEKASLMRADSLAAKQLLVDARLNQGEYIAALELLTQFLGNFPENTWFVSQQAGLLAKTGNFQEALSLAAALLAENPGRLDITLLKARILWEMGNWRESVAQYEAVLTPPLEELLGKKMPELVMNIEQLSPKDSWWPVLDLSEEKPANIFDVIMLPEQAVDFSESGRTVNAVTAEYYALYRWQDRFNKELEVRRSVLRREYYHAANKLENLIEEFGSNDFLLYDLAGLYSKLERLGDEAAIYRQLKAQNALFPGLEDTIRRNNLKRRPTAFLTYNMLYDDGWDGYKSVRQQIFKGGGQYYHSTNQKWNFDLDRIHYESTRDSQNVWSWRTMLTYDVKLSQGLGLSLGGGFEKPADGINDTVLLHGALTGKIADEMRAVFSVNQDVVADTIASLKRNIKKQDYKIELMFDLFPRLLLGGYYDFIDYSDSNWTNNYTFWASYIIFPEPTLLEITYNYDFYDSREGQKNGVLSDDGFASEDHPYWSPLNYWITRFSFYFKHQLSNDTLARGVPSYYTLEYSFGYDSQDNDLQELRGSLNLEIAQNYILRGSYGYVDLDVYQHEEVFLSLIYRF